MQRRRIRQGLLAGLLAQIVLVIGLLALGGNRGASYLSSSDGEGNPQDTQQTLIPERSQISPLATQEPPEQSPSTESELVRAIRAIAYYTEQPLSDDNSLGELGYWPHMFDPPLGKCIVIARDPDGELTTDLIARLETASLGIVRSYEELQALAEQRLTEERSLYRYYFISVYNERVTIDDGQLRWSNDGPVPNYGSEYSDTFRLTHDELGAPRLRFLHSHVP